MGFAARYKARSPGGIGSHGRGGNAEVRRWLSEPETTECSSTEIGCTGSGKSEAKRSDLDELLKCGEFATLVLDHKGPLVYEAYGGAVGQRQESRCIFHALSDPWVMGLNLLQWSDNPDPYQRELEDDFIKGYFKQIFIAAQGGRTDRDEPWKKDWIDAALDLHRFQKTPKPVYFIHDALLFDSDNHKRLIRDCTNERVRDKFVEMGKRRGQNRTQAENELGGGRRRLESLVNPLILAHTMATKTLDIEWALREKKQIYISGAGITKETMRVFSLMLVLMVMSVAKRHMDRTGKPLPVVIVLEEAGATELVAPFVIEAMQTLRYAKVFFHVMSQSLLDFEDEVSKILQNSPRKRFFKSESEEDVARISKLLMMSTFDAKAVHYTRDRSLSKGPREVKTTTRSRSQNAGKQEQIGTKNRVSQNAGQTVTEGTSFVNEQEMVTDEFYKGDNIQQMEWAKRLFGFKPGHCVEMIAGRVYESYTPMLERPYGRARDRVIPVATLPHADLFPNGFATLFDYRTRVAIHGQRELYPFLQPARWIPPNSQDTSELTPTLAPRTAKPRRGMQRSGG